MSASLPVSVTPRTGESIESWLEHLADANGLSTAQLLTLIRRDGVGTRYLTLAPAPGTITHLAALARVDPDVVAAATLAAFDGTALDLTGLDVDDRHSYRQVAARGWAPAHGTQICPACLADTNTWQSAWRLLIVTACTHHQALLVAQCPSCQRPFRDQRHSHLRRVGAVPICGNPLGAGPTRQCQHDLTTITPAPAPPAVLAMQTRVDTALTRARVPVLGQRMDAAAYLRDLRHLTTLLLHLARQPGADRLADWAATLPASTGTRRWGIRPPDNPGIRAHALATADTILAAPDLDTAVTMFIPWVELTPTTPDGPLGWLADRTVMTPTITRLVMAARAPRWRLSHHLDTREHPMLVDTRGIPQVIHADLYTAHLAGASSSSAATVRLIASLCLARMHPDVTSWAKAAEILGMPAAMGVTCARTCSATLLVDHTDWARRLDAVWDGLRDERSPTGRWNYRNHEAKIAHRRLRYRWFAEWAKDCRPGTRPESRGHALTWQWVHLAHGHLHTSPSWGGRRPNAAERSHYRKFETSLDEQQQVGLASALNKRLSLPGSVTSVSGAGPTDLTTMRGAETQCPRPRPPGPAQGPSALPNRRSAGASRQRLE